MWVICLSAEQTADRELIQRLSRALIQVRKERSVLLLRLPSRREKLFDALATKARGRALSSHLNEEGIAVVNVEGTDRQVLKIKEEGGLQVDFKWISQLLDQGILVSLSLIASDGDVFDEVSLSEFVAQLKLFESAPDFDALILINKQQKRRILLDDEPVSSIKADHEAINSRVLDENIIRYLPELAEHKVYLTSPIALLSKGLSMSTLLVFS